MYPRHIALKPVFLSLVAATKTAQNGVVFLGDFGHRERGSPPFGGNHFGATRPQTTVSIDQRNQDGHGERTPERDRGTATQARQTGQQQRER